MKNLIVILGVSRSGKDTIADYITSNYGYTTIHVLSDLYTFLEQHFNLSEGSIRTGNSRHSKLPGGDSTLLDYLVSSYHTCNDLNINFTKPFIDKVCKNLSKDTILTGVRNKHEVDSIIENSTNYYLNTIKVSRLGFNGLSTDNSLDVNWERLKKVSDKSTLINNDRDLEALYSKARRAVKG